MKSGILTHTSRVSSSKTASKQQLTDPNRTSSGVYVFAVLFYLACLVGEYLFVHRRMIENLQQENLMSRQRVEIAVGPISSMQNQIIKLAAEIKNLKHVRKHQPDQHLNAQSFFEDTCY